MDALKIIITFFIINSLKIVLLGRLESLGKRLKASSCQFDN
ncbi:hypothetical protein FORMB_10700 [Formosa sp. Hel1_33_131]|nr:hypothetical protein FORMB_10700 [Formosa sp. Hel1_33_131]